MRFFKSIRAWWRGLFRKRRFNMLNATDNSEEWHMHLSPASIFAAFLSFVLLLFILILSLVAYSPILELLPGYRTEADRSRESLVQNIIRLDSMERMMNDMLTYNENIAQIEADVLAFADVPHALGLRRGQGTRRDRRDRTTLAGDDLLGERVPFAARGTASQPFRGFEPAVFAEKCLFDLCHTSSYFAFAEVYSRRTAFVIPASG